MKTEIFADLFLKRCNDYYDEHGSFGIAQAHACLLAAMKDANLKGVDSRIKWEYKIITFNRNIKVLETFNKIGEEAWELIISDSDGTNVTAIFKRPKQYDNDPSNS